MDERARRLALVGVLLSIFMGAMESTVVATAMPKVVEALGSIQMYSWVFSGFLLTSTVTMPLWGRLSDLYGRRRMFLTGLTVFLAGSALSGCSADMTQLIVFRMLQGLGAGSLITIGMTIVGDLYGLERRAKMQGYISGVWGVASLVGPLLGGVLTDYVSWRWIFFVNLPIGAVAMLLIATALSGQPVSRRRPVIDYGGLILFTVGVSALLLGVREGGRDVWTGLGLGGSLVVAVVALAGFVSVERRAPDPIVPLRLFGNRMVVAAVVTGFLAGTAMFGAILFVPLFMQAVTGASATWTGFVVLTPFILGWTACSVMSARLVLHVGYRNLVIAGMICLTGAFFLFTRWSGSLTALTAARDVLLAGVGMGCTMVPMLIAVQGAVSREHLGAATSVTQFFRTVGGAIGLSVMGAMMAHQLQAGRGMAEALHGVFVVGLIVCVGAFLSAFLVPSGRAQDLTAPGMSEEPTRAGG